MSVLENILWSFVIIWHMICKQTGIETSCNFWIFIVKRSNQHGFRFYTEKNNEDSSNRHTSWRDDNKKISDTNLLIKSQDFVASLSSSDLRALLYCSYVLWSKTIQTPDTHEPVTENFPKPSDSPVAPKIYRKRLLSIFSPASEQRWVKLWLIIIINKLSKNELTFAFSKSIKISNIMLQRNGESRYTVQSPGKLRRFFQEEETSHKI